MPKQWYVIRVQSNREEAVSAGLARSIEADGLESLVSQVLVPTQQVMEIRGGKRKHVEKKLFPGYVLLEIEVEKHGVIPDPVRFLIYETTGVGDFIGAEGPTPLADDEVARLIGQVEEAEEEGPALQIAFNSGDLVEIKEGPFHDMKGHVEEINSATGRVKVVINVFNRPTSVELNYWQVEPV